MYILLLLIIVLLSFRCVLSLGRTSPLNQYKLETLFCNFAYLLMILLAMFRGDSVGADTAKYINDYQEMSLMSFSDIFEDYAGYEGYYLLSKIFSLIGIPYFVWFGFIEFMLIWSLSRYINKFSKDRLYSIILFVTTGLFMFSLAGLKQTLGLAIMMHAFMDLVDKKYIRSALFVLIAYFTHPVSLLSLLAFIIYILRNKKILLPLILFISLFVCAGGLYTTTLMVNILGNDHFEMYLEVNDSYTKSTLYLYCLLLICTLPWIIKSYKKDIAPKVELGCVILACSFQYLASFSPSLFRLAYAFLPFLFVYVPNSYCLSRSSSLESSVVKYCVLGGTIFFSLYSNRSLIFTFMN